MNEFCSKCWERRPFAAQGTQILGLCKDCSKVIEKEMALRGNPIEEIPPKGASRQFIVLGVRIWWWRGSWRVAHG
jgi:hypothetical protein